MELTEKDKQVKELIAGIIYLIVDYNEKLEFRGYEIYGILESVKHTCMNNIVEHNK
jgi:hypothetical protein